MNEFRFRDLTEEEKEAFTIVDSFFYNQVPNIIWKQWNTILKKCEIERR